jgi:hypothetical protein
MVQLAEIVARLAKNGQSHVLESWDSLNAEHREVLLNDLKVSFHSMCIV